ncbi:ATP6 synthase, partial [Acromyrmex charruanus]
MIINLFSIFDPASSPSLSINPSRITYIRNLFISYTFSEFKIYNFLINYSFSNIIIFTKFILFIFFNNFLLGSSRINIFNSTILLILISIQILLYILEISASIIQAYVFSILSTLYSRET